jgi:MFS family permease
MHSEVRRLVGATLFNTIGNGIFAAIGVVYFVKVVSLTPSQVTVGLAIGGAVALLVGVPAGRLADRYGPRPVYIVLLCTEAAAVFGYAFVTSWPQFLAATIGAISANRATAGVRNAYIALLFTGPERIRVRALMRSVTNVGLVVGSSIGGLALSGTSGTTFAVLLCIDAVSFLAVVAFLITMPAPRTARTTRTRTIEVLRDRRFLAMTVSQSTLSLHLGVLATALPLWIVERTGLEHVWISIVLATTALGGILFQVPASRGTDTLNGAARAGRRSGLLLAASCLLIAMTVLPHLALPLLLAGAALRLAGELLQAASSWAMSFALSPPDRAGTYQSLLSTGYSAAAMISPLIAGAILAAPGPTGWCCLAALFTTAAFAAASVPRIRSPRSR